MPGRHRSASSNMRTILQLQYNLPYNIAATDRVEFSDANALYVYCQIRENGNQCRFTNANAELSFRN